MATAFRTSGVSGGALRQHGTVVIETLGGYRLVRKLGDGGRADVMLAHPLAEAGDAADSDVAGGSVAIKVYRPEATVASIAREAEALGRARGPHVTAIIDVTTDPAGLPSLILARIPGPSLARLLSGRTALAAGEALTILVPLAVTMQRMHVAGVAHGDLRSEAVLFDRAGSPTLVGFGAAELIEPAMPPARADVEPAIDRDLEAFARLASLVLSRVADPAATQLAHSMSERDRASAWVRFYVDRLFELAPALPIDLRLATSARRQDGAGWRVPASPSAESAEPVVPPARRHARTASGGGVRAVAREAGARLAALASALPTWRSSIGARARAVIAPVRTRVWAVAGSVAVALVLALLFVPQTGSAIGSRSTSAAGTATADPESASPRASDRPSVETVAPDPVTADDPAAALIVLAAARDRCIRDRSILCLDDVDQDGSSARASDITRISGSSTASADDPWSPFVGDPVDVTVTERLGGSAIVDIGSSAAGAPRSVLLVYGDHGWRLRAYVSSATASGSPG